MNAPLVRTRARLRVALVAALVVVAMSCARVMPAGFWTSYRADLIVDKFSDQGPWGGSRWVHWEAKVENTFTPDSAVQFATDHGWTCAEPVEVPAARLSRWMSADHPVFALFSDEPDSPGFSAVNEMFPRHIQDDSLIIKCETGWIRVRPGCSDSNPAFGYIQISKDGRRMAVYHLWGDV